jgi:hypothetical protein
LLLSVTGLTDGLGANDVRVSWVEREDIEPRTLAPAALSLDVDPLHAHLLWTRLGAK